MKINSLTFLYLFLPAALIIFKPLIEKNQGGSYAEFK